VEFSISFLDERHPELLAISAVTVQGLLSGGVVRDASVDLDVLPFAVFEKLEHSESILKTVLGNQVPKDFRVNTY
jgi:hypothetical protein